MQHFNHKSHKNTAQTHTETHAQNIQKHIKHRQTDHRNIHTRTLTHTHSHQPGGADLHKGAGGHPDVEHGAEKGKVPLEKKGINTKTH